MSEQKRLVVEANDAGKRLDVFAAEKSELSRAQIQKMIKEQELVINNQVAKANLRVSEKDEILLSFHEPLELKAEAEEIAIEILYEDGDIAVVNKPQGMVVHPAAGNYQGTLVNALLYRLKDLSGIGGVLRPGIVHRIDKDTSGILVVAKNDLAHIGLAGQIKAHSMKRVYHAVVHGVIEAPTGTIDAPIGRHPSDRKKMAVTLKNSKEAVTHFRVLERFTKYTYLELQLETGRTHQIRVHMSYAGHPVVGDPVYGRRKVDFPFLKGQVLHAAVLGFNHPRTGEYLEFSAPLPAYFEELLKEIRQQAE